MFAVSLSLLFCYSVSGLAAVGSWGRQPLLKDASFIYLFAVIVAKDADLERELSKHRGWKGG